MARALTDDRDAFDTFAGNTARKSVARLSDVLARLSACSDRLPVGQNAAVAAELFTATERLEALAAFLEHTAEPSASRPTPAAAEGLAVAGPDTLS
jgi:hypothetical protein